jgi:hypothetical protein
MIHELDTENKVLTNPDGSLMNEDERYEYYTKLQSAINVRWLAERRNKYKDLDIQLEMIWDDIDSGLFGEDVKSGNFYNHIKAIKEDHPKPE